MIALVLDVFMTLVFDVFLMMIVAVVRFSGKYTDICGIYPLLNFCGMAIKRPHLGFRRTLLPES